MGVTNTPELCMWGESHNRLYGITNNPYDLERHAGGSSGLDGQQITAITLIECSYIGCNKSSLKQLTGMLCQYNRQQLHSTSGVLDALLT